MYCCVAYYPLTRFSGRCLETSHQLHSSRKQAPQEENSYRLEPLAEVEGALLVVEVLHAPHPELGGLLLVGSEHSAESADRESEKTIQRLRNSQTLSAPTNCNRWASHCHTRGSCDHDWNTTVTTVRRARPERRPGDVAPRAAKSHSALAHGNSGAGTQR